jgi:peptidyl-prolyl cis-trans isomerase SurA
MAPQCHPRSVGFLILVMVAMAQLSGNLSSVNNPMLARAVQILLLVCCFLVLPIKARGKVIEQLIAVIDGEPYTLSNLDGYAKSKMARSFPTGDLSPINASDREVLEQFLTEKLIEAEVREAGIKITDAEVDQYIQQVKQANRLSDEDLKIALSREGQTPASYRSSVKAELEKNELINRQVKNKVNITNDDVERYYKLNSKNYRADDRAHIRVILLTLPEKAPAEQVQATVEKAKALYDRIKAGEDFATLAREYSQGAGSVDGGDIGWIKRGTLIAGIEEVAFDKLSIGQVSPPFRTSLGVQILKLEGRESGNVQPLSVVAPKIREELYAKALEERFNRWLKTDMRRKHRVDVKIAGVVFKPEDSKESVVDSLMAKSTRPAKREDRSFMSYLNPLSYIVKETPLEDEDKTSPVYKKKVVTVFGVPLFSSDDDADEIPDVLSAPPERSAPSAPSSSQSGGFFDSLNPFSSKKP